MYFKKTLPHPPVTNKADGHDPDVEDRDHDKDDWHEDAVDEDEGVGGGQVVQHGGLGQDTPTTLLQQGGILFNLFIKGTVA